jgi:hypothetical protein
MYLLYPPYNSTETFRKNKMSLAIFYPFTKLNSIKK